MFVRVVMDAHFIQANLFPFTLFVLFINFFFRFKKREKVEASKSKAPAQQKKRTLFIDNVPSLFCC